MRHLYFNLKDLFSNRKGFVILTSLLWFKNKSREFREQRGRCDSLCYFLSGRKRIVTGQSSHYVSKVIAAYSSNWVTLLLLYTSAPSDLCYEYDHRPSKNCELWLWTASKFNRTTEAIWSYVWCTPHACLFGLKREGIRHQCCSQRRYILINSLKHRGVSSSRIVFMNKNPGRIRALSWYLAKVYQSHNNKNNLTRPRVGPKLNAWVSK